MCGDDHTYEKKRTLCTTRTSRTMSLDNQAASGSVQDNHFVLLVNHDGYLDPVVMPTASASLLFYASAQDDRLHSLGQTGPDYPPFSPFNHGQAVATGYMQMNGSCWHIWRPGLMGKGATPR